MQLPMVQAICSSDQEAKALAPFLTNSSSLCLSYFNKINILNAIGLS